MSEVVSSVHPAVKDLLPKPARSFSSARRGCHPAATSATARCTACPVRQDGFCQALSKRLHARVAASAVPVTQAADHWFWDEESVPRFVGLVRHGFLRMLRYSADGRRMITGIAGPGGIVGEMTSGRRGYGLETSTPVSMCTIDLSTFKQLMAEEPQLRRVVHAEQARCLDVLRRHIWSRGIQTPEERLSAFLNQACDALPNEPLPGGGEKLTLDIPRADIADLIGTTRETISRITRQWQAKGLIDIPDARHFIIHDRDKLAEKGGLDRAVRLPLANGREADAAGEPTRLRGKVLVAGRTGLEEMLVSLRSRRRRVLSYL